MRYFGTLFDKNYMAKGLALHLSMEMHIPGFQLFVLCLDDVTYEYLTGLGKPTLRPIWLAEVEVEFPELTTAKGNRSTVEYYFTLSPAWPLYLLRKFPDIDLITTLDADIYFFSDPKELYNEIEGKSILITPHRFPVEMQHLNQYGRFNVSFQVFRNDVNALVCLTWWYERCIEWCYDRLEGSRFADQKYLDEFEDRFTGVGVLNNEGAGLAPWNINSYRISKRHGRVCSNGFPLIFYHFHYLKEVRPNWYLHGFDVYKSKMKRTVMRHIYQGYIETWQRFGNLDRHRGIPNDARKHVTSSRVSVVLRSKPLLKRLPGGFLLSIDLRRPAEVIKKIRDGIFN